MVTEDEFDEGSKHVVPPPSPASAAFRPQVEKAREFCRFSMFLLASPSICFAFSATYTLQKLQTLLSVPSRRASNTSLSLVVCAARWGRRWHSVVLSFLS